LAAISAVGILGGFLAPWFVGILKDVTGDFRYGLGTIASFGMLAAIALYAAGRLRDAKSAERIDPSRQAAAE
jgi:cyanate permease